MSHQFKLINFLIFRFFNLEGNPSFPTLKTVKNCDPSSFFQIKGCKGDPHGINKDARSYAIIAIVVDGVTNQTWALIPCENMGNTVKLLYKKSP